MDSSPDSAREAPRPPRMPIVGLDDADHGVDGRRVLDDDVEDFVGARAMARNAFAVAQVPPSADHQLMIVDREIMLDLRP